MTQAEAFWHLLHVHLGGACNSVKTTRGYVEVTVWGRKFRISEEGHVEEQVWVPFEECPWRDR